MTEAELLARIVAQQQYITALHSKLTAVRQLVDPVEQPNLAVEIDAVLTSGESDYAAAIEAEIARRVALETNPN